MKTALIFLFMIPTSVSFAQMVNNIPLKDIDAEYIEFYALRKPFRGGTKHYLYLNYGQEISVELIHQPRTLEVKNDNDTELAFNSEIDCLNFMVKYGYELVSKNERVSGDSSFPVFLMRRIKIDKNK
jgi:hypothetical protein